MMNGQTGDMLMKIPTPNAMRLNRSKFRALIAEGLDIQVRRSAFPPTSSELIHMLSFRSTANDFVISNALATAIPSRCISRIIPVRQAIS